MGKDGVFVCSYDIVCVWCVSIFVDEAFISLQSLGGFVLNVTDS